MNELDVMPSILLLSTFDMILARDPQANNERIALNKQNSTSN